jgi:hypothetical protein
MPPGIWQVLITRVATMPVPQVGHGLSWRIPLSPKLARAVFDIFSAISQSPFSDFHDGKNQKFYGFFTHCQAASKREL